MIHDLFERSPNSNPPRLIFLFIYLLFYVAFNSQGHIAMGSLQVEETSAYCTVNHRALASNYHLSNMKCPARDSNRQPQRLEARTLTATPPSPLPLPLKHNDYFGLYFNIKTPLFFCLIHSKMPFDKVEQPYKSIV